MAIATSKIYSTTSGAGKRQPNTAANHEIKTHLNEKKLKPPKENEELKQVLKAKESEVHENNRTQKRLEDEVATIEERTENQKGKLYGGEVIAIKELQALEMDIESLKERQTVIEDQIIEVMELNEPIENEIQSLLQLQENQVKNEAKLSEALNEAINEIEIRISKIQAEINQLTKDLPSELINEYESLRSRPGHVGIAKLVNRTCNGCNLELPAVEVDRIKKFLKIALSTAKNAVASWFVNYAAMVRWPLFHYRCNSLCEPCY